MKNKNAQSELLAKCKNAYEDYYCLRQSDNYHDYNLLMSTYCKIYSISDKAREGIETKWYNEFKKGEL